MSSLPFELLLALRYLRPKRTFVSVITLISVLGVMLGIGVLIIVMSVMSGFDRELHERIVGFSAHLKVFPRSSTMKDYAKAMSQVAADPRVRGVAPWVMAQVLAETQVPEGEDSLVRAPALRGVDPISEGSVSVLTNSIVAGKFDLENNGLLIGSEFAAQMHLKVGDRLGVYSPRHLKALKRKQGQDPERAILADDFLITGVFDVGYFEFNSDVIVTSLENAQGLYDLGDTVHGLQVMLVDPYAAELVRKDLLKTLGPDFAITLWTEENSAMLSAVMVEKNVMFFILFFIMIVAALCILSALITFVVQKTREIGMLKALGATDLQISGLFLSQSLVIGVTGVVTGYGFGMLALVYRNEFLHFLRRLTGWQLFPAEIYHFTELPSQIIASDVVLICASALVMCVLGGVIPAWRAGRLQPVEALRHE